MTHIASLFAEGCAAHGVAARVVVDGHPLDHAEAACVIVAPHEYFPLHFLPTRPTIELAPTLAAVALVNVEQPGSTWFEVAWDFARRARHVFDISPTGVAEFQRRGVEAVHTPLGFSPSLEASARLPLTSRPTDVVFFGHASARRNSFLARHARTFSAMNCEIVLTEVHRPRVRHTAGYLSGDDRLRRVADSKIVLSVHASDRPYFEQHRAVLALANGSLLVTETSLHTAPLVHGVHFMAADLDELPALCDRLLRDPSTLARVAGAGAEAIRARMPIASTGAVILDCLGTRHASADIDERQRVERTAAQARLHQSLALQKHGPSGWALAPNAAFQDSSAPALTVAITLFNYAQYIDECLASVLAAANPEGGLEIVIVDDMSTDGGAERVEQVMAAAHVPMLLARKTINSGLADARNVGLTLARGRHVFVLDADNWIYPSCLLALQAALAADPTLAAAYGHIARVEQDTGRGLDLVSSLDWDPRRLVEGPYLDAMALLDREAVLSVGGYSTELIDHAWFGWEDYDLWLKLAQAGRPCRLVPRIVAGYRDHGASMLRRTNRDSERLAKHFKVKFAELLARHPGLDTHFAFPAEPSDRLPPEQAEIMRLRAHTTALEQQLADVYASKSWRVTRPLRTFGEILGKRRT